MKEGISDWKRGCSCFLDEVISCCSNAMMTSKELAPPFRRASDSFSRTFKFSIFSDFSAPRNLFASIGECLGKAMLNWRRNLPSASVKAKSSANTSNYDTMNQT